MEDTELTKAVLKDGVIRCGKCNHKIAEGKALRIGLGNGTMYIKCSHKSQGVKCKVINEINL